MTPRPKRHYRGMNREKAERMRALYFAKPRLHTQAEIGAMFRVGQNTVSRIISGMTWA